MKKLSHEEECIKYSVKEANRENKKNKRKDEKRRRHYEDDENILRCDNYKFSIKGR